MEVAWAGRARVHSITTDRRSGDHGFTLVELLVVVTVLGIVAGIVVFAVRGAADKSRESSCVADTNAIRRAEEANFARHEAYTDGAGLVTNGFLSEPPRLHAVVSNNVESTYTITPADDDGGDPTSGTCGAVGAAVGTCGPAPGTACGDPDNR